MNKLHIQYGAALLAAPVFIFLHNTLFHQQAFNVERLNVDIVSLFFLLLFYPVVEELAFRGVIQELIASRMKQYSEFYHLSVANIITSILFVMMHFVHHAPIWALLVFIPSFVFGYFKEQYNHVGASIILHMFYNACSLFLIL